MPNLTTYLNWLKKRQLAPETIRTYLWGLNKYGAKTLTTAKISQFLKNQATKYQTWTIRNQRNALHSYAKFKKLRVDWEIIAKVIPSIQRKFFVTISLEELERLKAVFSKASQKVNERNNLMLDFLFYTGIRVNELVNIKHSDYQNGQLRVLGKGNKIRFVFVPEFLTKHFKLSNAYLFLTRTGNKLKDTQVRTIINRKTRRAGIQKNIPPHTFRRSFATLLNNKGAKLTTIQKLLGHTHITTTAQYIHNDYDTLYADYSKLWINSPSL